MVPLFRSKSATVRGMRSPPSRRRSITKWPGWAAAATSGASTSQRNVVSENASRRTMVYGIGVRTLREMGCVERGAGYQPARRPVKGWDGNSLGKLPMASGPLCGARRSWRHVEREVVVVVHRARGARVGHGGGRRGGARAPLALSACDGAVPGRDLGSERLDARPLGPELLVPSCWCRTPSARCGCRTPWLFGCRAPGAAPGAGHLPPRGPVPDTCPPGAGHLPPGGLGAGHHRTAGTAPGAGHLPPRCRTPCPVPGAPGAGHPAPLRYRDELWVPDTLPRSGIETSFGCRTPWLRVPDAICACYDCGVPETIALRATAGAGGTGAGHRRAGAARGCRTPARRGFGCRLLRVPAAGAGRRCRCRTPGRGCGCRAAGAGHHRLAAGAGAGHEQTTGKPSSWVRCRTLPEISGPTCRSQVPSQVPDTPGGAGPVAANGRRRRAPVQRPGRPLRSDASSVEPKSRFAPSQGFTSPAVHRGRQANIGRVRARARCSIRSRSPASGP